MIDCEWWLLMVDVINSDDWLWMVIIEGWYYFCGLLDCECSWLMSSVINYYALLWIIMVDDWCA